MTLDVKFSDGNTNVAAQFGGEQQMFPAEFGSVQQVTQYIGGIKYTPGDNISITEDGVISVLTASDVEEDNTRPVTSAAVATQVGNIEILLKTI